MAATILVVDGNKDMREFLRLHLRGAGYGVLVAEDPVIAGHLLLERRIDLLLADAELPYMSGIEFVRAVKSDPFTSTIPVVMLRTRDTEPEATPLDDAAVLTKPLNLDHLLAALAKQLRAPPASERQHRAKDAIDITHGIEGFADDWI